MFFMSGSCSPIAKAIANAPNPDPNPFIVTISMGSRFAIWRVQLFSSPQHIVAPRTNSEPREKDRASLNIKLFSFAVSSDSNMLAIVNNWHTCLL